MTVTSLPDAETLKVSRGFQTHDAELELGRVLGELAGSRMP